MYKFNNSKPALLTPSFSSTSLLLIFLALGILCFAFSQRYLYSIWLIISSFFPFFILFFTNPRLFFRSHSPVLACVFIVGFFIDLLSFPLTPTTFFLISSYSTARIIQRSISKSYYVFLWLTRLLLALCFFKLFFLNLPLDSVFLFSKNMIFLPFMPFIGLFFYKNSSPGDFIFSHHLTFWASIAVILSSLSVGNIVLGLFILFSYASLVLSHVSVSRTFRYTIIFFIFSVFISFAAFLPSFLNNNLHLASSSARAVLLGRSLEYLPRVQIIDSYQSNLNSAIDFTLGPSDRISGFVLYNNENNTKASVSNPHNSLIFLHSRLGIAAFFLYLIFVLKAFLLMANNQYSLSFFMIGVIIRSLTDDVLVATGFSAFVLFLLLLVPLRKSTYSFLLERPHSSV